MRRAVRAAVVGMGRLNRSGRLYSRHGSGGRRRNPRGRVVVSGPRRIGLGPLGVLSRLLRRCLGGGLLLMRRHGLGARRVLSLPCGLSLALGLSLPCGRLSRRCLGDLLLVGLGRRLRRLGGLRGLRLMGGVRLLLLPAGVSEGAGLAVALGLARGVRRRLLLAALIDRLAVGGRGGLGLLLRLSLTGRVRLRLLAAGVGHGLVLRRRP